MSIQTTTVLFQAGVLAKGWGDIPEGVKFERLSFELHSIRYRIGKPDGREWSVGLFTRPAVKTDRFQPQRGPSQPIPGTAVTTTADEVTLACRCRIPPYTYVRSKVFRCGQSAQRLYVDLTGEFLERPMHE